jgi:methyl-accepting chemotaxis protein
MDRVTQQTAASAEESASAAEELNAQAMQMRGYVDELAAVVGGAAGDAAAVPERKPAPSRSARPGGDRQAGKVALKKKGVQPKTLIPFDEEKKGDFKDF